MQFVSLFLLVLIPPIALKQKLKRTYRVTKYVVYRQTLIEPQDHVWTFIGAFIAIALIGGIQTAGLTYMDNVFLIGSFGASAVLIFGATNSPLAQPRNLIGGHLISAIIGVTVHKLLPDQLWLASGLAVATSIVAMQMTKTLHPPGGATALIANIGSEKIKALGWMYILSPVMTGVLIMFAIAMIVNNIPRNRHYPYKRKL
ncbi:MAG: HPP family protein [Chitinophagales bacterium]|nr:HPP family protein [Chitinophagales bacterium]